MPFMTSISNQTNIDYLNQQNVSLYKRYQWIALGFTFLAYVLLHSNRKAFSNVKSSLQDEWAMKMFNGNQDHAETFLGAMDSVFMFSYAAGLLVSGRLGDIFDMKWVLGIGMCGAAIIIASFPLMHVINVYHPALYACLWSLNGLFQSTGWPACVAIVANWWGKDGDSTSTPVSSRSTVSGQSTQISTLDPVPCPNKLNSLNHSSLQHVNQTDNTAAVFYNKHGQNNTDDKTQTHALLDDPSHTIDPQSFGDIEGTFEELATSTVSKSSSRLGGCLRRGVVMGIWSANASLGNIVGASIVSVVLAHHGENNWSFAFSITAALLFAGGILMILLLKAHPHEIGFLSPAEREAAEELSRKQQVLNPIDYTTTESDRNSTTISTDITIVQTKNSTAHSDNMMHTPLLSSYVDANDVQQVELVNTTDIHRNIPRIAQNPYEETFSHPIDTMIDSTGYKNELSTERIENGSINIHARARPRHKCDTSTEIEQHPHTNTQQRQAEMYDLKRSTCSSLEDIRLIPTNNNNNNTHAPKQGQCKQSDVQQTVSSKAIPMRLAFAIPGVLVYSMAYACLKSVNYTLFFWLPLELKRNLHMSQSRADQYSTYYDWGGIAGGAIAGIISDYMPRRSPVIWMFILVSVGGLALFRFFATSGATVTVLSLLVGILIGGPANLISSAIAADVGETAVVASASMANDPSLAASALSTVTGIVDGLASLGTAGVQTIVPAMQTSIQQRTGNAQESWDAVFYLLMGLQFLSALCLTRLFWKDMRVVRVWWRQHRRR